MALVLKPPTPFAFDGRVPSIFLAGSIEMGKAENWHALVEQSLADLDVVLLNPRRDAWDATWVQSLHNPEFREQVEWELNGLESASMVAVYFSPSTSAPVTILELGLSARRDNVLVCCPEGFWRKGNIEVVCQRYGIPLFETLAELIAAIRQRLATFP